MAFTPKGAAPLWQPLFDVLAAGEIGDLLTYEGLAGRGMDIRPDRGAFYQAVRQLEKQRKRTVECVHGVGYKLVDAPEHARLARTHQRRSFRQIGRARRKLDSADRTRLSGAEAQQFDEWSARLSQVESMVRRVHKRLTVVEAKVETTERGQEQMQRTLESVVAALADAGLMKQERAA